MLCQHLFSDNMFVFNVYTLHAICEVLKTFLEESSLEDNCM